MKNHLNNNLFLVFTLALFSGCSTVAADRTPHSVDRTLQPVDCTTNAKRKECLAVANLDKKTQKKTAKSMQSEQRARLAKIAENKKINDEKAKMKPEGKPEISPVAQDETVVSKPEVIAPKGFNARASSYSASMDCVKNNIKKKDDRRSNVRAVAYELAVLCRQKGVEVDSIANGTVPLLEQNRAQKR